jgi:outer membrane receptor protein involved in Fe transport
MTRKYFTAGAFLTAAVLSLAVVPRSFGQAVATEPTTTTSTVTTTTQVQPTTTTVATTETTEEVVRLSPFVVDAAADQNGYKASTTLAGTRVRSDLKDIASSISVVTQQFLQDTGAKNNADLLVYTPSTEVAGIRGNFTGIAGTAVYQENTVSPTTRVRGLDSADNTRNYFISDIPWDGYNVGRVDLQRGPNSILFGTGSPAGIINTSLNDASFKTAYNVENRIDQYGSVRNSINFNQVLLDNQLAIRIAALKDNEKYEQHFAYNNSTRYYGAIRYDPKLFGESNHTSIRANFEKGQVRSNNPRQLPPVDEITPWFKSGADVNGNLGFNKMILNQYSLTNANPTGMPLPGGSGGVLASATYELGGWSQTRTYWPDVLNYYEQTQLSVNNTPGAFPPSGTPIKSITGTPNLGLGLNNSALTGSMLNGFRPFGIPSMSQYAAYIGTAGGGAPTTNPSASYPQHLVPGGVYYNDTVITDPSIFNFYTNLLDGPNKQEWQNWQAFNVALDQSFFNDRLAIEVAVDHQAYDNGAYQWLTGSNYAISIDVNATYADGTNNPNAGRPYVGNSASAPSLNNAVSIVRNTFRVTPTYELRASDFLGDTTLAKILGRHNFTGLYESNTVVQNNVTWAEYVNTPAYITDNNQPGANINSLGSNREFDWLAYLGPNLSGASSASGSHLSGINMNIAPPPSELITNFNSNYNATGLPMFGQQTIKPYVDPSGVWVSTNNNGQVNLTNTQSNNPANYVGWQLYNVNWMYASNPQDYPALVQSAGRTNFRDISTGFTWQGHFLDGDLVPAFGWRKDVITNFQTSAITDTQSGFTSLQYPDNISSRTDVRGESKSWGGVYHLPKALVSKLPGDMTISLLYDYSQNFKADAMRMDLAGNHIPNATGKTKEYGIVVTALNEKLSLKVNWFETKVAAAPLGQTVGNSIGGLGNNAYFLADGTIWGYAWAASLQDGLRGQTPGTNYYDYASADGFQRGTAAQNAAADNYNLNGGTSPNGVTYVGGNAVVNAWLGKGSNPIPIVQFPLFFSSFNLIPNIDPSIGARTGNLRDSITAGYNDANGPQPGGGSNFGDHQTTVDNKSTGWEVELTAQPIKNWNVTLNYAKVKATHESIDSTSQQFIGAMTGFMNGPGGQVREWWNGGNTLGGQWNPSLVAPYVVYQNALGHEAPEVSPWRINVVTTYTFDHGVIKGAFIGGALRTEAGRIIGYKFNPNFVNKIAGDPNYATNLVPGLAAITTGGLDINQPFRGANETHVDAWIGYTRKLTKDINWRIQVNMRSVGEKDRLVAAQTNPDGSMALARIVQGMGWQLTNSLDF